MSRGLGDVYKRQLQPDKRNDDRRNCITLFINYCDLSTQDQKRKKAEGKETEEREKKKNSTMAQYVHDIKTV